MFTMTEESSQDLTSSKPRAQVSSRPDCHAQFGADILEVTWAVAHKHVDLFVDHGALLKLVVEEKGAFW